MNLSDEEKKGLKSLVTIVAAAMAGGNFRSSIEALVDRSEELAEELDSRGHFDNLEKLGGF